MAKFYDKGLQSVRQWEDFGFLPEWMNDDQKIYASYSYDKLAKLFEEMEMDGFLRKRFGGQEKFLSIASFALVSRLVKDDGVVADFDPLDIIKELIDSYEEVSNDPEVKNNPDNYDVEAEATALAAKRLAEKYNKEKGEEDVK